MQQNQTALVKTFACFLAVRSVAEYRAALILGFFVSFFTTAQIASAGALAAAQVASVTALVGAAKSSEAGETVLGRVHVDAEEVVSSNANATDQAAILATVYSYWRHYLHGDVAKIGAMLSPDVRRLSQRAGKVQDGAKQVLAELPKEWQAFERPNGLIAEAMTLRQIDIEVAAKASTKTAIVRYWVEIEGGSRWNYDDQGWVLQIFSQQAQSWKLRYQSDSWNLNHDLDNNHSIKESFDFDFVYPVQDLARALRFYTPLMGKPAYVNDSRAAFNLGGPLFILDGKRLDGITTLNPGKPAGYAIIYVDDLRAERAKLIEQEVEFLAGTDQKFKMQGPDPFIIIKDAAGNLLLLMQKQFASLDRNPKPTVQGLELDDNAGESALAIMQAWLQTDVQSLNEYLAADTRWFDDLRIRTQGVDVGESKIKSALQAHYWSQYDCGVNGLKANAQIVAAQSRAVGQDTLVSYLMILTGNGAHAFQDSAFVTLILDQDQTLKQFMMVQNNSTSEATQVLELDYTGYPTHQLSENEDFYTDVLDLGSPYTDSEWRGYWSSKAVFGIFTADPKDGLLRPGKSNGYVSLWVRSAQQSYDYLKAHNASFPVIPAINSKAGVDAQPGYLQVYGTDSEGNGLIFTEYTGRRR